MNCSIGEIFFVLVVAIVPLLFFGDSQEKSMAVVCVLVVVMLSKWRHPRSTSIQNLQDFFLLNKTTPEKGCRASPRRRQTLGKRLITGGGVPGTQERWIRGLSRRAGWMGTCKTKPSFPED